VKACCDFAPHTAEERRLFDECACCGGPFSFGPSTSATCHICAEGERLTIEANLREAVTAPMSLRPADSPWNEEPF
jgi:hypothetical protein